VTIAARPRLNVTLYVHCLSDRNQINTSVDHLRIFTDVGRLLVRVALERQNSTHSDVDYPDRLGTSRESVENSTKLTCLETTDYRIKYSTVVWLLELQIRRGRKVFTRVHTLYSNSHTSHSQCSLFSKTNPIIQIFRISRWLAVPINPDEWSSTVLTFIATMRLTVNFMNSK
jgi:hypothetical protein